MGRPAILALAVLAATLAACGGGGGGGGGPPAGVADFLHVTSGANRGRFPSTSEIDHPLANGNPDAVVLVTHNWNPPITGIGRDHDHPVSTGYDELSGRWFINNVDRVDLDAGVAFNVTVASGVPSIWKHVSEAENVVANTTMISRPGFDDDTDALTLLSQNGSATGGARLLTLNALGLKHDGMRWTIHLQTPSSAMSHGLAFNLYDLPRDPSVFLHRTTVSNTSGATTTISHPDANGNRDAHVQITLRNDGGRYLNDNLGVYYDTTLERWGVLAEGRTAMPLDLYFVVRVK